MIIKVLIFFWYYVNSSEIKHFETQIVNILSTKILILERRKPA